VRVKGQDNETPGLRSRMSTRSEKRGGFEVPVFAGTWGGRNQPRSVGLANPGTRTEFRENALSNLKSHRVKKNPKGGPRRVEGGKKRSYAGGVQPQGTRTRKKGRLRHSQPMFTRVHGPSETNRWKAETSVE